MASSYIERTREADEFETRLGNSFVISHTVTEVTLVLHE